MKTEKIAIEIETIFVRFGLLDKLRGELVVNTPLTGEKVVCVTALSRESIEFVLQNARAAQERWKVLDINTRSEFLAYFGRRLADHSMDLAKLVHYDSGKSVKESIGEVASAIGLIESTIRLASYEALPSGAERSKEFTPLGVIAIISPFNFSLSIGMWTGIPALLAGNSVVNKPSENASLPAILYEAIFRIACKDFNAHKGVHLVPESVFQIALGGPEVGKVLAADARIAKVVFTGSIAGCEKIRQADCDAIRTSKALTEGGAANFAVFSDHHSPMARYEYVKFIVGAVMKSFLPYAGQKCVNTRQLVVHKSIVDEVVEEFRNQLNTFISNWRVENAFSDENPFEFSPLINQQAGERFQWALRQAVDQGGTLICGERKGESEFPHAQYFMPAIAVFEKRVALMDEEIFGPFITILSYDGGIDEALELAQKPNANLVNAYYGSNEEEVSIFKRENTAGFALINPPLGTALLPMYGLGFGGNGLSGQGESLARDPLLPFVDQMGVIRRNVTFKLPGEQVG